jgi:UDP-2,3-diacylglucosamine pyrophosphatase LpxH
MLTHADVLTALQASFPADAAHPKRFGVGLVAQYADPGLALPRGRVHIFIPDCHLLSQPDLVVYPKNHFQLDAELLTLLECLKQLKQDNRGDLLVWHMGDLFDIWRTRGGRGDQAEVDAIAAAYKQHMRLLTSSPPNGLRARILAGNHDYMTHELPSWAALRVGIIENQDAALGDILVVHGDLFDWLELSLPDELQACIVRAAKQVSAGRTELLAEDRDMVGRVNRGIKQGDVPIGPETRALARARPALGVGPNVSVNVVDAAAAARPPKFFDNAAKLAVQLKKHGHDIRAVVIGHTHHARIVQGKRSDGKSLALMDCGAWMGQCRLASSDPWIWSAQLGVIADAELRIYQLGWKEA